MGGRFIRALLAVATATAWMSFSPAHAVVDTIVVTHVGGNDSNNTDYVPGSDALGVPAVLIAGQTLQYLNMNTGLPHDLISDTCVTPTGSYVAMNGGGACTGGVRLFASSVLGFNMQGPVARTNLLPPGDYGFYCSVHGPAMAGRLSVVGP